MLKHTDDEPVSPAASELPASGSKASRLHALHRRATRLFIWACQVSMACVAVVLCVLVIDSWLLPGSLGALDVSGHVAAQIITGLFWLAAVGMLVWVPLVSMLFLVLSLLVGHEPDGRELKFAAFALMICALGLALFVAKGNCGNSSAPPDCHAQVLLFVIDQFNHGSFGDVFDVFDISFSSIGFDKLDNVDKLFALNLRMLCAATVVSLLMRWLGAPLERLSQHAVVQTSQRLTRKLFLWACYASVCCLMCWALALALEPWLFPGFFHALDAATDLPSQVLRLVLLGLLAAIPAVVPLVSLVHLVLSLLVGHTLRGREFLLSSFVLVLCAAGLWAFIEGSACKGSAEQVAACADEVPGYVVDQFYKGAFADVFDVYELKFGNIESDSLSTVDKLMILNFRLLCAVYVVGVLVALQRWRSARKERKSGQAGQTHTASERPLQKAATPSDGAWEATVFADTLPMQMQRH